MLSIIYCKCQLLCERNYKNGKEVISKISANKFFQELKDNYFRNDEYPQAIIGWTEEDARDSYNVINPYDD